jgi:hypothetical protein
MTTAAIKSYFDNSTQELLKNDIIILSGRESQMHALHKIANELASEIHHEIHHEIICLF